MTELITSVGPEQMGSLPPNAQESLKKFSEGFDLSIYHVSGGVWNQNTQEVQEKSGIVGNYIVVGKNYKDGQGNTRTPQRFYRLNQDGSVRIDDDEFMRGPDGEFLGYAGQIGIKSLIEIQSPNLNVAATLVKDDQEKVTGLSFVRAAPKGEKLDFNLSSFQNISFKKK